MRSQPVRSWADITSGYRFSLVTGASGCLFTPIVNLAVTIWAATLPDEDQDGNGRRVLFQGSCKTSKDLNIGLHLLTNMLSSLLLGATNYGMQCLSSPTREQVDKAHASGCCLDIGIISLRNLWKQTRLTRALWYALVVSSVPLHLLYNSVIFASVTIAREYQVIVADEPVGQSLDTLLSRTIDLERQFNTTLLNTDIPPLRDIANEYKTFERLTPAECIDAYSSSFVTSRSDVILVRETPRGNNFSHITTSLDGVGAHQEMYSWLCWGYDVSCSTGMGSIRDDAENWAPFGDRIQYCLSRPMPEELCRVNYNLWLAVSIIAVNAAKLGILIHAALYLSPDRMLVLGDAVQSFLSQPDVFSRQSCLASISQSHHALSFKASKQHWTGPRTLVRRTKRWISPVSGTQIGVGTLIYLLSLGVSIFLLVFGIKALRTPTTWGNLWSLGFGQPNGQALIMRDLSVRSSSPNIVGQSVLANIPHLTFSLIYFQWNTILTTMLMGREWNNFSQKRAALRVSDKPSGDQRTRYFLQLPYKFTVPSIIISILLHWILSQCIFVVSVEVLENMYDLGGDIGNAVISWGLVTCGYSPIAIMTCVLVSIAIPISVIGAGCRRLRGLMPVAGSCSLAIAAACHHADGNAHPNAALEPLAWGVMVNWAKEHVSQSPSEIESVDQTSEASSLTAWSYEHCGFSNRTVDEPQEGKIYA